MPKLNKAPSLNLEFLLSCLKENSDKFHKFDLMAQQQVSYDSWQTVKHHPAPDGITVSQWWQFLLSNRQLTPIGNLKSAFDKSFTLSKPDSLLRLLHEIDKRLHFSIQTDYPFHGLDQSHLRDYLQSSVSESISSSQLEGAVTTTSVAKKMIMENRKPKDESEQMIQNNYQTMENLKTWKNEPLTIPLLKQIHAKLMKDLLPTEKQGEFRQEKDKIIVADLHGEPLHFPPPAEQLEERLGRLFDWVNQPDEKGKFLHPIVKASILHFMIGYEHPFCDGNGRTARALFFWYLMRHEPSIWLSYLSISSVLKKPNWRKEYGQSYLDVEQDNFDLTYFVLFQLKVFLEAIHRFHRYVNSKIEKRRQAKQVYPRGLNIRQIDLLNHLQRHPDYVYTAKEHSSWHHISLNTARQDLATLAKLKYLKKIMQGKLMTYVKF